MKPINVLKTAALVTTMVMAGASTAGAQSETGNLAKAAQAPRATAAQTAAPQPTTVRTTTPASSGTALTIADRRNVEPPFVGPCYRGLIQAPCSTPGPSVQVDLLKKKPSWSTLVGVPRVR